MLPLAVTALLAYVGSVIWSIRISLSSSRLFPRDDWVGLDQFVRLLETERWNRLHPTAPKRVSHVQRLLGAGSGPVVATSDFMRIVPEQVARFVTERRFVPLGTDGMGRSDTREALRAFFETDMPNIVLAVIAALVKDGKLPTTAITDAITKYGLDPLRVDPYHV